jgi:hypothetical protein
MLIQCYCTYLQFGNTKVTSREQLNNSTISTLWLFSEKQTYRQRYFTTFIFLHDDTATVVSVSRNQFNCLPWNLFMQSNCSHVPYLCCLAQLFNLFFSLLSFLFHLLWNFALFYFLTTHKALKKFVWKLLFSNFTFISFLLLMVLYICVSSWVDWKNFFRRSLPLKIQ